VTFLVSTANLFIWGLNYTLGEVPLELPHLEQAGLIAGDAAALAEMGYSCCRGVGENQSFLGMLEDVSRRALAATSAKPRLILFQHALFESATAPWDPSEPDAKTRYAYSGAVLLRELGLDHLPYFCLFQNGCAGFAFLLMTAAGQLLAGGGEAPVICVMGDRRPENGFCDMARERILGSDHASSFVMSGEPAGYQLLGVDCYSTPRTIVPLVEIVQRTMKMIRRLAQQLSLDLSDPNLRVHYPNIFPDAWKLVTRGLRLRPEQAVMIDMPERAHCGGSDSLISLSKLHGGNEGRIHVVVTYGAGVHLAIAVLREQKAAAPALLHKAA